jgi:hypothetical protein
MCREFFIVVITINTYTINITTFSLYTIYTIYTSIVKLPDDDIKMSKRVGIYIV